MLSHCLITERYLKLIERVCERMKPEKAEEPYDAINKSTAMTELRTYWRYSLRDEWTYLFCTFFISFRPYPSQSGAPEVELSSKVESGARIWISISKLSCISQMMLVIEVHFRTEENCHSTETHSTHCRNIKSSNRHLNKEWNESDYVLASSQQIISCGSNYLIVTSAISQQEFKSQSLDNDIH